MNLTIEPIGKGVENAQRFQYGLQGQKIVDRLVVGHHSNEHGESVASGSYSGHHDSPEPRIASRHESGTWQWSTFQLLGLSTLGLIRGGKSLGLQLRLRLPAPSFLTDLMGSSVVELCKYDTLSWAWCMEWAEADSIIIVQSPIP